MRDADIDTCDNCGEDRGVAWVYETGFTLCGACLEDKLLKLESVAAAAKVVRQYAARKNVVTIYLSDLDGLRDALADLESRS